MIFYKKNKEFKFILYNFLGFIPALTAVVLTILTIGNLFTTIVIPTSQWVTLRSNPIRTVDLT